MYSAAIVGLSAFAIAALAQDASIAFTQFPPDTVTAGSTVPLPYTAPDLSAPVTITLLTGCPNDCQPDHVLTSTVTGGSYTWNVDASQAPGTTYGLSIAQGSVSDYSNHFAVVAGASTSSSSTTPVSQIGDNQPQAATSAPASAQPVSQISDNQPQAATSAAASAQPVSQISDNQPQAPTSAAASAQLVSQISDNQPQAPTSAAAAAATSYAAGPAAASPATGSAPAAYTPTPASTPAAYTGAASNNKVGAGLVAMAGVAGVLAML